MYIKKCCATCQYHQFLPLEKDWICANPENDIYNDYTEHSYKCDKWKIKQESNNGTVIRYYLTKKYTIKQLPIYPFKYCIFQNPIYIDKLELEVIGYAEYDRELTYQEEKQFGLIMYIDN